MMFLGTLSRPALSSFGYTSVGSHMSPSGGTICRSCVAFAGGVLSPVSTGPGSIRQANSAETDATGTCGGKIGW